MKRLLLSVFAAAITAAWLVPAPATASDVTLSGQYRLRGEFRDNADFDKTVVDNAQSWGQRVRLTANAQATDDTSVKITLQDTRLWGAVPHPEGNPNLTDDGSNTLDLHESYVKVNDLGGIGVDATIGRQEVNLGDQRLIGAFGWHNNGRSFDAFRFDYKTDDFDVLAVASKILEADGPFGAPGATGDDDMNAYILQGTLKSVENNIIEAYWIRLHDADPVVTTKHNTLGVRVKGSFQDFGYTVEVPYQTGESVMGPTTLDWKGLAYAIRGSYKLPVAMDTTVGFEYTSASGDDDPADNEIGTFLNLAPTNHAHLGSMDRHGWRNITAWSLNAKTNVNEKLSVKAAYWSFKLKEKTDGIYGAGNWNNIITPGAPFTEDALGGEIDLTANYKYNSAFSAQLGVSRYFPGDARGANADDQDWAYLMLTANF